MPDDAVSHVEVMLLKERIDKNVQRNNLSVVHIVANLPANAPIVGQDSYTFVNDSLLPLEIVIQAGPVLVGFSNVVWG
jgi:hypothetical protein